MRNSQTLAIIAVVCLSWSCRAQSQPGPRPTYDGRWWLAISDSERDGVIEGYLDCHTFELKGSATFLSRSHRQYRELLTKAYRDSNTAIDRDVSEALQGLRDKGRISAPSAGQPTTGRHNGNDGLFWKQIGIDGHEEQKGFVEGYLLCHEKVNHSAGGVFPRSPEEYRALITNWYRFDEKTGDIDGEREGEAIANVLYRVRAGRE